jgi:hypothetical protein
VGLARAVAFASVPLTELDPLKRAFATPVTVNDLVLAATAGGLHRWLEHDNAPLRAMRVKVPVSLHTAGAGAVEDKLFRAELVDNMRESMLASEAADRTERRRGCRLRHSHRRMIGMRSSWRTRAAAPMEDNPMRSSGLPDALRAPAPVVSPWPGRS